MVYGRIVFPRGNREVVGELFLMVGRLDLRRGLSVL